MTKPLPLPPYTGHPLLAALETAISESETDFQNANSLFDPLQRSRKHVDPLELTRDIEEALGDAEKLDVLRIRHREALIRFEQYSYRYSAAGWRFQHGTKKLYEILTAIVQHMESAKRDPDFAWQEEAWMLALVRGEMQRRKTLNYLGYHNDKYVSGQALNALQQAFATLVQQNKDRKPSGDLKPLQIHHKELNLGYITEPACPFWQNKPSTQKDKQHEIREVAFVPFEDSLNTKHPALQLLADLLPQLSSARKNVTTALAYLRQEAKGRVNEQQYAERLVQQVLIEGADESAVSKYRESQLTARREYEQARLSLFMSIAVAHSLHHQVVNALLESIAETQALHHFVTTEDIVTVDIHRCYGLGLINCLGADVLLRACGRSLHEAMTELQEDLTGGNGRVAIYRLAHEYTGYYKQSAKFAELAKQHGAEGAET